MGGLVGLAAALLAGVLVAVAGGDPAPPHVLDQVFTCQDPTPAGSQHLSVTLDGSQIFWFDFPGSRWNSGVPSVPPWPRDLETPREILEESQLCREILEGLEKGFAGVVPEGRAIPTVTIFPVLPPILGEPNALVCLVENIFPPDAEISWKRSGISVTDGIARTPFVPGADLTFRRFSRISVVPKLGDVHECVVTSRGGNASAVAYWVPPDTALDEQLSSALVGAAVALGIVLGILGIVLALLARRERRSGGWS